MTRAEIFEVLKANLFEIVEGARGKEISEDRSMKDYSADSLEMVEVVSRSMKALKVKVPRTSLSTAKNLKELLDLFEEAARAKAAATEAAAK
jgi:acyl carrier protein